MTFWAGTLELPTSPCLAWGGCTRASEVGEDLPHIGDPRGVLHPPHPELTPATLQPPLTSQPWGSSPSSQVLRLEKHSRSGVGGWINPTGGRDWVEWGEDAGIESIYHALEARSSLIAHEAL